MSDKIMTLSPEYFAAKTKDVTSTEVSALPRFDLNKYKTSFELWWEKKTGQVLSAEPNERMRWGVLLEPAIAEMVREVLRIETRPFKEYLRKPKDRLGASFDHEVLSSVNGPGILEIKNVDAIVFKNEWDEDNMPPPVELQIQAQMEVAEREYAYCGVCVGGNTLKTYFRKRDRKVGKIILKANAEFWAMVEADTPPAPDFSRDAAAIARLYSHSRPGLVIEADEEISSLVMSYMTFQETLKHSQAKLDEYKARLLERIGEAEKVVGEGFSISAKEVQPSLGTLITEAMVGQTYGGRKGYRTFRVNKREEKKNG